MTRADWTDLLRVAGFVLAIDLLVFIALALALLVTQP